LEEKLVFGEGESHVDLQNKFSPQRRRGAEKKFHSFFD